MTFPESVLLMSNPAFIVATFEAQFAPTVVPAFRETQNKRKLADGILTGVTKVMRGSRYVPYLCSIPVSVYVNDVSFAPHY